MHVHIRIEVLSSSFGRTKFYEYKIIKNMLMNQEQIRRKSKRLIK